LVEIHAFAIVQRRYGGKPSPAAARNCRLKTADEKYNAVAFLPVVDAKVNTPQHGFLDVKFVLVQMEKRCVRWSTVFQDIC
jgi:hypothetical protein